MPIYKTAYEEAIAHFKRLTDAGFVVLFVPGNHDYGTGAFGSSKYIDKFKKYFYGTNNISYPIKTIIDNNYFANIYKKKSPILKWKIFLFLIYFRYFISSNYENITIELTAIINNQTAKCVIAAAFGYSQN